MTSKSNTLILLDPDASSREVLQGIILDYDLSVQTAYDWADALRLMMSQAPMAFVFSLRSVPADKIEGARQLRQRFPDVPLVGIRGTETPEEIAQFANRLYACLDPAHLAEEFAYNLVRLIAGLTELYHPFALHYEERLLLLTNDFALVMPIAKTLVEDIIPPQNKHRYHYILGLSEIVTNAIEHGNLGFSFEEKTQALKASRFYSLAQERAQREPYASRKVTVRRRVQTHLKRVEYFVADQGRGFDWRSPPDPKDEANLFRRHGRGLLMARHAFDSIQFNETGNEVTLVVELEVPERKD